MDIQLHSTFFLFFSLCMDGNFVPSLTTNTNPPTPRKAGTSFLYLDPVGRTGANQRVGIYYL